MRSNDKHQQQLCDCFIFLTLSPLVNIFPAVSLAIDVTKDQILAAVTQLLSVSIINSCEALWKF